MGILFFIVSVVLVSVLAVVLFVRSPFKYFKTEDGNGVLFGIVAAVGAVSAIALFAFSLKAEAFEYFNSGEVYLGLDSTHKISPMCYSGENSDRLTSNLGVRAALVSSDDNLASINFKYTHHSCAFNPDNRSYDAAGVELTYKIW